MPVIISTREGLNIPKVHNLYIHHSWENSLWLFSVHLVSNVTKSKESINEPINTIQLEWFIPRIMRTKEGSNMPKVHNLRVHHSSEISLILFSVPLCPPVTKCKMTINGSYNTVWLRQFMPVIIGTREG